MVFVVCLGSSMLLLNLAVLFSTGTVVLGFFEWKNCVVPAKEPVQKVLKVHGCEDQKEVNLTCATGSKISVTKAFFGHGHGHKAICDSSWLSQNCGTKGVRDKVTFLCQDKQSCTIKPTGSVLGSTSCMFGLDADLFIEYVCNPEYVKDVVSIQSMTLEPSPLTLPGKLNTSISLLIKRQLPSTTKLKLKIEKKVFGAAWVTIPCVSNYGSCTYDNFCGLLRGVMFSQCDRNMQNKGIPCNCPIPTGKFTVPTQSISVTKKQIEEIPVWNWLVEGKYRVKAEFLDVYNRPLGCIQLQAEVDINSKKKKRSINAK